MPINGVQASAGKKPATPTIGTATDGGTGTTVSVAFTPSSYIGKGTITYTATSNPGSITATGSSSPITVSSLTAGTAYTFTVKGDTNYGVASDTSSASNSVTPAVPTSFDSIATSTPTSGTTVTFSSIPNTYKSLQIRINAKTDQATTFGFLRIQVNGDTGTNYAQHNIQTNSGTLSAGGAASNNFMGIGVFGGTSNSSVTGTSIIDVIDYASTSKNKTFRGFSGLDTNTTSNILRIESGAWFSTSAITSISIYLTSGNFSSGTSIALYGVK